MKYKGEPYAMRQPLADDDFYDATGIIDPGFDSIFIYSYYIHANPLSNSDKYIITTNGEYYNTILDRNNKNISIEVDKILAPYRSKTGKISWLVIDVPNFRYKAINPYNNENGVVGVDFNKKDLSMSKELATEEQYNYK